MEILRIKEVLKERGITGKDLSIKVKVTPASISNIVSGNSFPKPELLQQIATVLDVDIRDLFHPTKDKESIELFFKNQDGEMKKLGDLLPNDGVELK